MAEYSRDVLRADGIGKVEIHELPAIVSFTQKAELTISSDSDRRIRANTLCHSTETGPDGIVGELVYVGSGGFSDYEGWTSPARSF